MKLSPHFDRKEFACSCGCGFDTVDSKLIDILERIRHHFNAPVHVNSGARCAAHNASVGGSSKSQHKFARAADIRVEDVKPVDVYNWLDATYPHDLGVGLYSHWIHVDTRTDGPARWDKS